MKQKTFSTANESIKNISQKNGKWSFLARYLTEDVYLEYIKNFKKAIKKKGLERYLRD